MSDPAIRDLTARIKRLEDALRHANRSPQLSRSSIDDGAVNVYSGGQLAAIIGRQFDGTTGAVTVAGPTPPVPSGLAIETVNSGVRVTLDGSFEQTIADRSAGRPTVAPLDFRHFEIEVSETVDFIPGPGTRGGLRIASEAGGQVFAPWTPGVALYARARCWSTAGKFSALSDTVGPVESGRIGVGDVGFDLAQLGGSRIFYGDTEPAAPDGGFSYGDLWLEEVSAGPPVEYRIHRWTVVAGVDDFEPLTDQGTADALAAAIAAQQAADTKARVFTQATEPVWAGDEGSAVWFDTANGHRPHVWDGADFVERRLGNGAITPQSLVASDVIATRTVTAALLEALLVLASTIVAGDPDGAHARMTSAGFRVYRPSDIPAGTPEEVVRMGTDTNDYFGVVDSTGLLAASIDDTGAVNGRTANFREDIVVGGRSVKSIADDNRKHTFGWAFSGLSGITTEIGLTEIAAYMEPGRLYEIAASVLWTRSGTGADMVMRVRDGGTGVPTLSSPELAVWSTSGTDPGKWSSFKPTTHAKVTAPAGVHRLLLTVARQGTGTVDINNGAAYVPALGCFDMGPHTASTAGSINRGGGATAPPVQQYDTGDMAPAGWRTYRGNGTQRTDVNEVVQGWDPSGFNGDGRGYWWWSLPSITGTVDRVDLYLYSSHWYYNSGGTAIINIMPVGTVYPFNKAKVDWHVGGFPKPGGKWVTLPSDWWHLFKNVPDGGAPRCDIISLGPSGGSNLAYYGKFPAAAPRLRIWYTQ